MLLRICQFYLLYRCTRTVNYTYLLLTMFSDVMWHYVLLFPNFINIHFWANLFCQNIDNLLNTRPITRCFTQHLRYQAYEHIMFIHFNGRLKLFQYYFRILKLIKCRFLTCEDFEEKNTELPNLTFAIKWLAGFVFCWCDNVTFSKSFKIIVIESESHQFITICALNTTLNNILQYYATMF